jgi:hypothetical protein
MWRCIIAASHVWHELLRHSHTWQLPISRRRDTAEDVHKSGVPVDPACLVFLFLALSLCRRCEKVAPRQTARRNLPRNFSADISFRLSCKDYDILLLQPLHWPRIVRKSTPLRAREAASADVVVVLTHSSMWVLRLASQAFKTIP